MGDGSLTQEEIDLLLQGADTADTGGSGQAAGSGGAGEGNDMSPLEKEIVSDVISQGMQGGIQGLAQILSKEVKLGTPYAEIVSLETLQNEYASEAIVFIQPMTGAISGSLSVFMSTRDGAAISAIVMGGDEAPAGNGSLDSAQLATIKDTFSPVLFAATSNLSGRMGAGVTPMPVDVKNTAEGLTLQDPTYLRLQIPMTISGVVDSKISVTLPLNIARGISGKVQGGASMQGGEAGASMQAMPQGLQPGQLGMKDVGYPAFANTGAGPAAPNMNLLMDVQMTLTVELGRTKMYIKEILGLGEGSIIELDKLAGEPVDLLVNGKLIAKGEVVVIDENFGVRVTDIVSHVERLKSQKQA